VSICDLKLRVGVLYSYIITHNKIGLFVELENSMRGLNLVEANLVKKKKILVSCPDLSTFLSGLIYDFYHHRIQFPLG